MLKVGQFGSAERLLQSSVANNESARAWFLLGVARYGLGKREAARGAFVRAAELDPGNADAHFNLGLLAEQSGEARQARERYQQALEIDPAHSHAQRNLGGVLLDLGHAEAALAHFDQLSRDPANGAHTHCNRARALFALYRDEEALGAAESALEMEPLNLRALLDRGMALAVLGRLDEAQAALDNFKRAAGGRVTEFIASDAAHRMEPKALWLSRLLQRQAVCDWGLRDTLVGAIRQELGTPDSTALAEPAVVLQGLALPLSPAELLGLGRIAMSRSRVAGGVIAEGLRPLAPPAQRTVMRIGILAAGIREHPEAYLLRRVLLDGDRSRFEYFLYILNRSDGSAVRREVEGAADRSIDLSGESSSRIAARIREDALDLLIDVSGATVETRPEVVAARIAPVQAGYLATPATLGEGLHDYRISDAWTTPPEFQGHWSERLVLLPPPLSAYDNSLQAAPRGTRSEHGLPETGFVFCAIGQLFKIEPVVFAIWMRLLAATPRSVLWLAGDSVVAAANLRREAQVRGVAPERLVFAPRVPLPAHLGRLQHADLFLDTFHCAAHTSALDALWTGLPVVTCAGETMAARMGATYVRTSGLEELVTHSTAEYERKALLLAHDPGELSRIRRVLAHNRATAPAFDTKARVRALERAFAAIVERSRAGLRPDTIVLG